MSTKKVVSEAKNSGSGADKKVGKKGAREKKDKVEWFGRECFGLITGNLEWVFIRKILSYYEENKCVFELFGLKLIEYDEFIERI